MNSEESEVKVRAAFKQNKEYTIISTLTNLNIVLFLLTLGVYRNTLSLNVIIVSVIVFLIFLSRIYFQRLQIVDAVQVNNEKRQKELQNVIFVQLVVVFIVLTSLTWSLTWPVGLFTLLWITSQYSDTLMWSLVLILLLLRIWKPLSNYIVNFSDNFRDDVLNPLQVQKRQYIRDPTPSLSIQGRAEGSRRNPIYIG